MSQEKKWKRGDIGPDGRVFLKYQKSCKNGERWVTAKNIEEINKKSAEQARARYEKNKEKENERNRLWRLNNKEYEKQRHRVYSDQNKEKIREKERKRYEKNKEKVAEKNAKWRKSNPEKVREFNRKYAQKKPRKIAEFARRTYQKNKEKILEKAKLWKKENPEKARQVTLRAKLRKTLKKYNATSYDLWLDSIFSPQKTIASILSLTPDEGQTLAELIHELSGYPMELCEQIANPPEPEQEPQPEMLDNSPPPVILPDLF